MVPRELGALFICYIDLSLPRQSSLETLSDKFSSKEKQFIAIECVVTEAAGMQQSWLLSFEALGARSGSWHELSLPFARACGGRAGVRLIVENSVGVSLPRPTQKIEARNRPIR